MQNSLSNVRQRATSYKFLSDSYYLPDEGLMQKVVDIEQEDRFFTELSSCIPPLVELESLIVDFSSLFVGPYNLLASPYGSVYLEDGKFMGDSTLDVRNCYESEGLDITVKDAPDPIAMELEFMYYLITKQIEAVNDSNQKDMQSYLQKQSSFLQTHLVRWVPEFAANVQKNAQTEFYKQLAKMTTDFVHNDINVLAQ